MVSTSRKPDQKSQKDGACPVCKRDHDTDCRWFADLKTVLCYTKGQGGTSSVPEPPDEVNGYKWVGKKLTSDGRCAVYVLEEQRPQPRWEKPQRPAGRTQYLYHDADGSPVVKVIRKDDGNGKKSFSQLYRFPNGNWEQYSKNDKGKLVSNMPAELKEQLKRQVPLYNLPAVMTAITNSEPVFLMEGEGLADRLTALGLTATTLIAGAGKLQAYNPDALKVLKGATVVLCPDRDQKGVSHMEDVESALEGVAAETRWLYAYPDDSDRRNWERLQKDGGADVGDWIDGLKAACAEQVKAAIGAKREVRFSDTIDNVVAFPNRQSKLGMNQAELNQEISNLVEANPSRYELEAAIQDIASRSGRQSRDILRLYEAKLKEVESVDNQDLSAAELDLLLGAEASKLDIKKYLPDRLSSKILKLSQLLGLRPELYLFSLLCTVSSIHHPETTVVLNHAMEFEVSPNLFAMIVAESSQKKSPVVKSVVTKPLSVLRAKTKQGYDFALKLYKEDYKRWEKLSQESQSKNTDTASRALHEMESRFPDGEPQEPHRRVFSFTKATAEGIDQQASKQTDHGMLYVRDELAGLLKSSNQYRGGKGSDDEDLLEYYDSTGQTTLRAGGIEREAEHILLSLFGSIQPKVLLKLMKDCEDSNGAWARFLPVVQPLTSSTMLDNYDAPSGFTAELVDLYEAIDALPKIEFVLEKSRAFRHFMQVYNQLEQKRVNDPLPAMRTVWGKTEGRIGKIAINLQVIKNWADEVEPSNPEYRIITLETIQAATEIALFGANQFASLYTQFGVGGSLGVSASLSRCIELSRNAWKQGKDGWIKAKDVQLNFDKKDRPDPGEVRTWFEQIAAMKLAQGKGELSGSGRSLKFRWIDSTQLSQTVGESPTFSKPYQSHGVQPACDSLLVGESPTNEIASNQGLEVSGRYSRSVSDLDFQKNIPTNPLKNAPTLPTIGSNSKSVSVSAVGDSPTKAVSSPTFSPTSLLSTACNLDSARALKASKKVGGSPTNVVMVEQEVEDCEEPISTSVIRVGSKVGKIGKMGWNGSIESIDSDETAWVRWAGDKTAVPVALNLLRLLD
jgi:hypothetical protein